MANPKVLPGTCRTAWSFMTSHWADLVQVSVVPLAALAVVLLVQIRALVGVFGLLGGLRADGTFPPDITGAITRAYGLLGLTGLVAAFCFAWLFVRLARLYAFGEKSWLGLDGPIMKAALMTLIYGVGIYFITMAAYLVVALGVMIPLALIGALLGGSNPSPAFVVLVFLPGIAALVGFLFWFSCRFMSGLPQVAFGESPDFFAGMWKLTAGESWGLPLRLIAIYLVTASLFLVVAGAIFWPAVADFIAFVDGNPDANTFPAEQIKTLVWRLVPVQLVFLVLQMPFVWLSALTLVEANRRFVERRRQLKGR